LRQLPDDRPPAALIYDHEHVAGLRRVERSEQRQVVVAGHDRERRAGEAHVRDHRPDRGIDHGQALVGVAERRHLDLQQAGDQVVRGQRAYMMPIAR
jgi:hypothetical protein